jgi:invasion protein IalB
MEDASPRQQHDVQESGRLHTVRQHWQVNCFGHFS